MGCDIHLYVEVQGDDRVWRYTERPDVTCVDCRGTGMGRDLKPGSCDLCGGDGKRYSSFYDCRNYAAFSVLADVRNRDDERALKPIAKPRGLPFDLSRQLKEILRSSVAEHGFGWLLLSEVLAYPHWDDVTRFRDRRSTVKEECGGLLEAMKHIVGALHPDPTRIRIVFGFDS